MIVIDSGVWISGFHFGGVPEAVLDYVFVHEQIAICRGITDEVKNVLAGKFRWNDLQTASVLSRYLAEATWVELSGKIPRICRDTKDDMVLECAVRAGAEVLISGDKDLLCLDGYENIRILTPRDYLEAVTPGAL